MYDGMFCQYYLNGQISVEGNYKENCEVGKWIWYNKDGSNKKIKNFGEGIINSWKILKIYEMRNYLNAVVKSRFKFKKIKRVFKIIKKFFYI